MNFASFRVNWSILNFENYIETICKTGGWICIFPEIGSLWEFCERLSLPRRDHLMVWLLIKKKKKKLRGLLKKDILPEREWLMFCILLWHYLLENWCLKLASFVLTCLCWDCKKDKKKDKIISFASVSSHKKILGPKQMNGDWIE